MQGSLKHITKEKKERSMVTAPNRIGLAVTVCMLFVAIGTCNAASRGPGKHKASQKEKQGQLLKSILSDVEIPQGDAKMSQCDYRDNLAAPLAKYLSDKFEGATKSSEIEPTVEQLMNDVNVYNFNKVEARTEAILNAQRNEKERSKAIQDLANFIISNLFSNPNNLSNFSDQIEAYKNLRKEDRDISSKKFANRHEKQAAIVCQGCKKAASTVRIITLNCGHAYCTTCLINRFMDRGSFNTTPSTQGTGPTHIVTFKEDKNYNECPSCHIPFGPALEKELYAELNKTMTKKAYKDYLATPLSKYLSDQFEAAVAAHQLFKFERLFASIWATFADKEFNKVIEDAELKSHTIRLAQGNKRSVVIQKIATSLIEDLFNNKTLRDTASYEPLFTLYDELNAKLSDE
jgi:hypothetical protein